MRSSKYILGFIFLLVSLNVYAGPRPAIGGKKFVLNNQSSFVIKAKDLKSSHLGDWWFGLYTEGDVSAGPRSVRTYTPPGDDYVGGDRHNHHKFKVYINNAGRDIQSFEMELTEGANRAGPTLRKVNFNPASPTYYIKFDVVWQNRGYYQLNVTEELK